MSNETLLPCSVCDGTGDQRGNPKFPPCEFCNGTGLRNRAAPPSPVAIPEEVVEAMAYAAHFESDPPVVGNAKLVVALARYIRSLSSPAPVEALPEGCPETAHFRLFSGLHRPALLADQMSPICNDYSNCALVEIHPVGTRQRLSALGRAASLPDAKNVLDARCICGHTFGEHGPELNCGMFVPSSDDSEQATPPVTNKRNPHA